MGIDARVIRVTAARASRRTKLNPGKVVSRGKFGLTTAVDLGHHDLNVEYDSEDVDKTI